MEVLNVSADCISAAAVRIGQNVATSKCFIAARELSSARLSAGTSALPFRPYRKLLRATRVLPRSSIIAFVRTFITRPLPFIRYRSIASGVIGADTAMRSPFKIPFRTES